MPRVKTEERDAHVWTSDYARSGHTQQRQHVAQNLKSKAPSDPVPAIAQASHEALLASGNVVYRAVLQELNDLRTTIARCQSQNMELSIHHEAARDAYMRLYDQMKAHVCHYSNNYPLAPSSGQAPNLNASRNIASRNPALYHVIQTPLSSLPSQVSASSQVSRDSARLLQVPVPFTASVSQVSLSSQVSPPAHASASSNFSRVSTAPSQASAPSYVSHVSQASISPQVSANLPVPALNSVTPQGAINPRGDDRLPTSKPGGPSTTDHCGPNSVSPAELHSVHPTNELFWDRSDWFRKGCPTNSFITDERGKPLTYLIKNIRAAARTIWTDIAGRPGSDIASSFKRSSVDFKREFVERIEEMHPCLKLCNDHWKALQVGISSYNYWYKRVRKGDIKRF